MGYYNTVPDLSFLKTKINENNKAMDKELFNSSAVEISRGVTSNEPPTKTLLGLVTQFSLGGRLRPRGERPRSWPPSNEISQKSFTLQIIQKMCTDYCLCMLLAPPTVP